MVTGLDPTREQLQWRLIYATKTSHIALRHGDDCSYEFGQRPVPIVRTEIT